MTENLTLPGWQNIGRIGAGGFGAVYEICMEDNPKYRAALKIITIPQDESELAAAYSEGMDDAGVTSYFQGVVNDVSREIAIMEHFKGITNIVSYEEHKVIRHTNDIGWDILIRMELLTPLQTFERARGYGLSEKETVKLGIDICRALVLCEKDGIVHRDIKPGNIFVNRFGDFVLGDFGIARQMGKSMSSMSVKGTYSYMAPEVYNGHRYGNTADIYSLGMVLYRCLNRNRGPFLPEAPTPITYQERQNALYTRMSGQVIPEPRNGSAELKRLVLKAVAYNPGDRFLSAGELMEALQGVPLMKAEIKGKKDSGEEKTEKINPTRTTGRQNQRRKNIKIALGIMAVAVVCLLAVFITMFSRRDAGNTYSKAIALMRQGAYEEAKNELNAIKGYEDSENLLAECESMMRWYPVYQRIIEHTTVKGVDCITHSKEERDEIKKVVSDDVTVIEFDPKEPSGIPGVFYWSSGGPDDFPVTIGDTEEKVLDQLGISEDMVEEGGCQPLFSDELKGISIGRNPEDNTLASIYISRTDATSISLDFRPKFSPDFSLLDGIGFLDEGDYSKEIEEYVKQTNYGDSVKNDDSEKDESVDNNEQINELGDSWTSFSVLIDNQKVTLPISYRELSSLGLNLSEPRNKVLKTLDMEDIMSSSEMIYINDNDGDFYFTNDSDEEINLDDCLTHRLSVKDTSIVFPKNVRVGDSIESVIEAYGNYQYASDKKTYYRWETKGSWNSLEIYTENNHVSRIELDVTNNSDNIPRTTENNTREDEYTSEKISSIAKNVWGSRVKWDDDVYAYFGFYEGDNPSECGMIFLSQQGDGSFHFSYYDGMATIEESDMDLGINILGRSVYTQKYTFAEESCVGASGEKVLHIAHVDDGSLLVYIEDEKGEHYYHLSRGDLPTYCDLHDSLIGINYG